MEFGLCPEAGAWTLAVTLPGPRGWKKAQNQPGLPPAQQ